MSKKNQEIQVLPTIVVHAGAGSWRGERDRARGVTACETAAEIGRAVLAKGGSAVDAVIAAVVSLEDNPVCNAGTGAVTTSANTRELDACVMDGATRTSGAVGALEGFPNPILIADALRQQGKFHLLVASGAAEFAQRSGFHALPNGVGDGKERSDFPDDRGDTVGAVALDADGHLACATSTGGMAGQAPGRLGDTPIVGAGSYADSHAACSCTGAGESFVRACTAFWTVERTKKGVAQAAERGLDRTKLDFGGDGGLIVLAHDGSFATRRNTDAMPWASARVGGRSDSGC